MPRFRSLWRDGVGAGRSPFPASVTAEERQFNGAPFPASATAEGAQFNVPPSLRERVGVKVAALPAPTQWRQGAVRSTTRETSMDYDPIRLEVFKNLLSGIAEEMGVTLCRTAFSP